jgi:hypothetical protein
MAFIGHGFDFNNDGQTDAIIGMNVGGREEVCGETFPHEAREMFSKRLNLPNGPCVILKCGFCNQDSVAYTNCPWCGAANTWQHNRYFKFNSGWLECSRCEKQLGDNPCPRCGQENNILNFHLLEYKTEEELRRQRVEKVGKAAGCAAVIVSTLLSVVLMAAFAVLRFVQAIPGPQEPGEKIVLVILLIAFIAAWLIPIGFAIATKVKAGRDPLSAQKPVMDFTYVRSPSGEVIGPVNNDWLFDRVIEGSATLDYQFANAPSGPWQVASSEEALLDKLRKLEPAQKKQNSGQTQPWDAGVVEEQVPGGMWLRLPNGRMGGPFAKHLILTQARQGTYPPGTVWSEQADGPWLLVPGVKAMAAPPPAPIASAVQWWIRTPDGKQSGPHTKEQLAKAAAVGRLPQGTVAANSPNGPWKKVRLQKRI